MEFKELTLNKSLQSALEKLGVADMTPIQEQGIPPALEGRDLIGCAQTGTGKTFAFLLPTLDRLLNDRRKTKDPRVVVLAPTRELVIQVTEQAQKLASRTPIRITSVYGGAGMKSQIDKLRRGTDIIIATPGRLMDHMRRRNVNLREINTLILDEADRMLDMGFLPDIKYIVNQLPQKRQTLLFSATMPNSVLSLAQRFQEKPIKIEIAISRPPETIRQALYPVPKHLKTELLVAILDQMEIESMLVFTATKVEAEVVTRKLSENNIKAACIHGDFKQRDRVNALKGFQSGRYQVLVATNVAARGLDIDGISHVINYDIPEQADDYIHRIGRTARAEADGDAISLVTPDDEALVYRIEYVLEHKVERKILDDFDYDVPAPSWAKPSAKALLERNQSRSLADRWRRMSGRR
ncbi:DEAD/DEAH box helicase [Anaerolineales bacterium HSG6]|nr:DEAD/DEAH box helicase [Anaerolineales bacterium HSG6]MDM8530130.1 DEAD/DEAH box helicase [Anaerolineales bacterium HSG25]